MKWVLKILIISLIQKRLFFGFDASVRVHMAIVIGGLHSSILGHSPSHGRSSGTGRSGRQKLFPGTFRTNDVLSISNKPLSGHRNLTNPTFKAIRVPMATFERNEPGISGAGNRFCARSAFFGNRQSLNDLLDNFYKHLS